MDVNAAFFNSTDVPKEAKWQDLVSQLKCPQCRMYQSSCMKNLEKHVVLQCKSRPIILKNHYVKRFQTLAGQANEEVLEIIRLNLEAKLLEWKKDGFPEIPILLRGLWEKKDQLSADENYSHLLTLWRLWVEEAEIVSQEHNSNKLMQLSVEAENLPWEPTANDEPPSFQLQQARADDQLNKDLMSVISSKLVAMSDHNLIESNNLDPETIERLEREAFNLSSISS